MVWLKRIGLFLLVNMLVMVTISVTSSLIFGFLGVRAPAGVEGLLILCAIMGFSGSFISLMLSKFMAKHMYGVQIIDASVQDPELRSLVTMVHNLAQRAGLPAMPEVGIYEAPEINAFATGPSKSNSLVAVSTGLLQVMNKTEIEGVLASIAVNYFSRRREFRADAGGANVAGREKMIAGLRKLQSQYDQIAPDNSGTSTLKISSKSSGIMALFSTHPPLEERIARLESL